MTTLARRQIESSGYTLAARQHGVVTRRQLLGLGWNASMIQRRVKAGVLDMMSPGTYTSGAAPITPRGKLQAAVLGAGPTACASGFSTLWLYDITAQPASHEVVVPGTNKPEPARGQILRSTRTLHHNDIRVRHAIRTVSVERALLDIALVTGRETLAEIVAEAIRKNRTNLNRLRRRLADYKPHWPNETDALQDVVDDIDDQVHRRESLLEDLLQPILARIGAPHELQHEVTTARGALYRIDAAFTEAKLAIEVDGYLAHCSPWHLRQDNHRQNALTHLGWRILRFTWHDITNHPHRVADEITHLLTQRRKAA